MLSYTEWGDKKLAESKQLDWWKQDWRHNMRWGRRCSPEQESWSQSPQRWLQNLYRSDGWLEVDSRVSGKCVNIHRSENNPLREIWLCVREERQEEWMLCEQACWCVCFLLTFIWGRPLSAPALLQASPITMYIHVFLHLLSPDLHCTAAFHGGFAQRQTDYRHRGGRAKLSIWL